MKIYTDNLNLELTIKEFESILNKGILNEFMSVIASLSEEAGILREEESIRGISSILNKIIYNEVPEEEYYNSLYDREDPYEEENNERVNRIYYSIFGNGEGYYDR